MAVGKEQLGALMLIHVVAGSRFNSLSPGVEECPAGKEITTPYDCVRAAKALGLPSDPFHEVSRSWMPLWCFVDRVGVLNPWTSLYFNTGLGTPEDLYKDKYKKLCLGEVPAISDAQLQPEYWLVTGSLDSTIKLQDTAAARVLASIGER